MLLLSKIIIVIFLLAVAGLLGFLGYRYYTDGVLGLDQTPRDPRPKTAYALWGVAGGILLLIAIIVFSGNAFAPANEALGMLSAPGIA